MGSPCVITPSSSHFVAVFIVATMQGFPQFDAGRVGKVPLWAKQQNVSVCGRCLNRQPISEQGAGIQLLISVCRVIHGLSFAVVQLDAFVFKNRDQQGVV